MRIRTIRRKARYSAAALAIQRDLLKAIDESQEMISQTVTRLSNRESCEGQYNRQLRKRPSIGAHRIHTGVGAGHVCSDNSRAKRTAVSNCLLTRVIVA